MAETNELEQQQHNEEKNGQIIQEMKPWEQHSAVISIPRFDYNAPSSLLQHSLSGFLITCPIKREKSATKEAISILAKVSSRTSLAAETRSINILSTRRLLGSATKMYAFDVNSYKITIHHPKAANTKW
ncbi:hypothetical protein RND81_02G151400 [Saponaria officinalis]|uniref:Uncharacterized protein n=1 Tax=Saponaria officinalis TaxID=3572 RepID=A0AAW1MU10_SAPOF